MPPWVVPRPLEHLPAGPALVGDVIPPAVHRAIPGTFALLEEGRLPPKDPAASLARELQVFRRDPLSCRGLPALCRASPARPLASICIDLPDSKRLPAVLAVPLEERRGVRIQVARPRAKPPLRPGAANGLPAVLARSVLARAHVLALHSAELPNSPWRLPLESHAAVAAHPLWILRRGSSLRPTLGPSRRGGFRCRRSSIHQPSPVRANRSTMQRESLTLAWRDRNQRSHDRPERLRRCDAIRLRAYGPSSPHRSRCGCLAWPVTAVPSGVPCSRQASGE